jgi:hypothetical protein
LPAMRTPSDPDAIGRLAGAAAPRQWSSALMVAGFLRRRIAGVARSSGLRGRLETRAAPGSLQSLPHGSASSPSPSTWPSRNAALRVASVRFICRLPRAENTAAKAKKSGSQWTRRWREQDSNSRFPAKEIKKRSLPVVHAPLLCEPLFRLRLVISSVQTGQPTLVFLLYQNFALLDVDPTKL